MEKSLFHRKTKNTGTNGYMTSNSRGDLPYYRDILDSKDSIVCFSHYSWVDFPPLHSKSSKISVEESRVQYQRLGTRIERIGCVWRTEYNNCNIPSEIRSIRQNWKLKTVSNLPSGNRHSFFENSIFYSQWSLPQLGSKSILFLVPDLCLPFPSI